MADQRSDRFCVYNGNWSVSTVPGLVHTPG